MAKSSISDQLRPWLAIFLKYYFWLLAAIVPLLLLPTLFIARGAMTSHIASMRQQIDGHVTALQSVSSVADHPNDSWSKSIEATTSQVSRETLKEWQAFWDSQKTFRVWPEETLGADFVKKVETLKPDGKLSPQFRERYKDKVRTLVRALPVRMGVEPKMGDLSDVTTSRPNTRRPPARQSAMRPGVASDDDAVESSPYMMEWSPENQQRIYTSFNWEKEAPPSPTRILLAQEELWVYGMFCDLLAGMNKTAAGPHSAAITRVDELSVGYPAAEDDPGGGSGKRLVRVAAGSAPTMASPDDDSGGSPSASGAAVLVRPANPRFGGGALVVNPGAGRPSFDDDGSSQAPAPANPDDGLQNWIYVDFTGKPLSATELAAAVDSQMVHLMPFVLRVVIDQRQIDALLVSLSTSAIPIDVRQVRINASGGPAVDVSMGPATADPMAAGPGGSGRMYDVSLELRGTIGLATPPSEKAVGLESAEAGDKAAMSSPVPLRRAAS